MTTDIYKQLGKAIKDNDNNKIAGLIKELIGQSGHISLLNTLTKHGYKIEIKNRFDFKEIKITKNAREKAFKYLGRECSDDKLIKWAIDGKPMTQSELLYIKPMMQYELLCEFGKDSICIKLPNRLVAVIEKNGDKLIWKTTFFYRKFLLSQKEFNRLITKPNPTYTENKNEKAIILTLHARNRTFNYLGQEFSDEKLVRMVIDGKIVLYSDLLAIGYRPNESHKDSSVYVMISKDNLIAVLERDDNKLIWKTTYTPKKTPSHRIPITEEEFNRLYNRRRRRDA